MVRKAKKPDLPKIYKIYRSVSLDRSRLGSQRYQTRLQKQGFLLGFDDKKTYLRLLKETPVFLVYEENSEILGYIAVADERTYTDDQYKTWFDLKAKEHYYKNPKAIAIFALAVDPLLHKKGVATTLLKALEKELISKGYQYLSSIVTVSPITNCPSLIFHTTNNFERIAFGRPRELFNIENYASILFFKELKNDQRSRLINLNDCQAKALSQGVIYLGPSDKNQSVGFLKLNGGQVLPRHNRPVDEKLKQIKGSSVVELYEEDKFVGEKRLQKGDRLIIPANQDHVHKNPTNKESLTYWQFDGDVREIIENIRKQ